MFSNVQFKDKTAIVTGGSRGIGKAITTQLAEGGAEVFFFYYANQTGAHAFVDEALSAGLKITGLPVDVRNRAACEETVNKIYDTTGRIDILVNNSGIIRDNLLVGLSEEDIQNVIDTNLMGVFHMTQVVTPFMMKARSGKIINISSVAGEKGGRGQSNYAATKGAINALTKALAVELAPRKITVNAVAPGVIETDISKAVRDMAGEEVLSRILLKRFGDPKEVAYAVAFLASSYADYITGQVLTVDGGFKMA